MTTIPVVCIALMGVLLFLLGANVTRHRAIRGSTGNQLPSDPTDRMFIAQRAHGNASEYVPILFATSPLAAMRSAPTMTAWMWPCCMTCPAIESVMSVAGMPALSSSQAVIRLPCNNGRVSSTKARSVIPSSFESNSGASAVP